MYDHFEKQLNINFKTVREIRKSENGSILLVKHTYSGNEYIIKRCKGEQETFRRLIPVKCGSLPEIYEVAEKDGKLIILEEYIRGDMMDGMLKGALFSEKETGKIAMDLCRALYVLHSLNIVHRDVKPENIILRGGGAVLLDLDASRVFSEEKQARNDTVILGTTGFAAPEQYGLSQTDGRADIYALGVTMNIMLTGEHPSVRLASGRMGRIISRCIMVHQGKRYRDIKSLMEVLG